jgi:hypothetical protein
VPDISDKAETAGKQSMQAPPDRRTRRLSLAEASAIEPANGEKVRLNFSLSAPIVF